MLILNRDPGFWREIVDHPQVVKVKHGLPLDVGELVKHQRVTPLATENGGFIFVELDGVGAVWELHALYRPEGWGREAHQGLKGAIERVKPDILTAPESDDKQSRPPLSFGFRPSGTWRESPIGPVRTWLLTRKMWLASPAARRL